MEGKDIKDRRVCDLVGQNGVYAYALYHLGIKFYEYSEHTLEQACLDRGVSLDQVIKELEDPVRKIKESAELPLTSCPIDLIIEYLRHTHLIYVKYKLPYIACLVESFYADCDVYRVVEKDLKMLFPLFLEDFIHHIHREEDTLFHYIKTLEKASQEGTNPSQLYYTLEGKSLQQYALEHEMHDDEMKGLREITNNYSLSEDMPLHMKVMYTELAEFEKSLKTHSRIENEMLFPKAILLENQIRQRMKKKISLN